VSTASGYPTLTSVEQAFKDLIWDPMIKAGEVWIAGAQAAIPFLDFAVVQGVEDAAIQAVTDYAFSQLMLLVDVASIELVSAERQSAYEAASEELVIIGETKGVTSSEYQQALQNALASFATLGRMGS
jgi:hypothetical protein